MSKIGKKSSRLQQINPVCPIEMMPEVSSLAIIALVSLSLDVLKISGYLPAKAINTVATYIGGLLWLDRKQTSTRIAQRLGGFSHDKLTRLLADQKWHCSVLMRGLIRLTQLLGVEGYLIIDDTLIPRPRSKKVKGAYWDYDHALKRNVCGHRVVVILWSDGFWKIPVAFSLWHKKGARPKYRTKNEIARTLLKWVVFKGIRPEYVVFDNWYASEENMKLIVKGLGLEFVTRLKSNCRLNYQGRKLQAKTIGRRLRQEVRSYKFKNLGVYARGTAVKIGQMGEATFVVVKDDLDGEGLLVRYLLSSTPRLSAREVVRRYKTRWAIEVWFEHLKQYAGGIAHQGRNLKAVEHHIIFSALSLLTVDWLRCGTTLSVPEVKNILQQLVLFKTREGQMMLGTLQPVSAESLMNLDKVKEIINEQLQEITPLKINKDLYYALPA
jgi:hypothetical protein